MKLEKGLWVAVVDGAHGYIYSNEGTAIAPRLALVHGEAKTTPSSTELGRDRPSRAHSGHGQNRGAFEPDDLHQRGEDRFIGAFIEKLDQASSQQKAAKIVLVAPPVAMGMIRKSVSPALKARIVHEITADYAKHAPDQIAAAVAKALEG